MIRVIKNTHSEAAIEYAKELLSRCESGEIVAITAIEETPRGTYLIRSSSTPDRFSTAGMLLEAAITRLTTE